MNEVTAETTAVSVRNDAESSLGNEVSFIEKTAADIVVESDEDFNYAGKVASELKRTMKRVKEYWDPMVKAAFEAHKNVKAHENEMIKPLEKAEQIVKRKMSDYANEKERQRIARENEMRRTAQIEMEKKLEEAAEAEARGDIDAAEYAMAEAEFMEDMSITAKVDTPKVSGITKTKTWRITGIDSSKVPVSINGVEIRPVDEKAILKLIKANNGKIEVPGVMFEEDTVISVRS